MKQMKRSTLHIILGGLILQPSFEQQLSGKYASLSAKLKEAADYVVSNPIDVATRSLRSISKDAGLSPATFSRMSNALGYDTYEDLRDVLRKSIKPKSATTERLEALQLRHSEGDHGFMERHVLESSRNISELGASLDQVQLEACVDKLHAARRVLVIGTLGSTGVAEYLTYSASFIASNWSMASQVGASLASGLEGLSDQDVLIVITKPPFSSMSVNAAREAHDAGAFVIVITDTHTCPALMYAAATFIVPTASQHFFSSYAATLVLAEIIVGMLASRTGPRARQRIRDVEDRNHRLGEVLGD